MKINENQKIIGQRCILVPYNAEHVPKYHEWMEDEEIRRLTGSERLSLDEEYEMQRSWRDDDDKLTFIILEKEGGKMVGDVNLFINWEDKAAECEIMIAEQEGRGRGIATEGLHFIISYALKNLKIFRFFAKITDDNTASLNLFEKKLKFDRISHSVVFGEYSLELSEKNLEEEFRDYLDKYGNVVDYQ